MVDFNPATTAPTVLPTDLDSFKRILADLGIQFRWNTRGRREEFIERDGLEWQPVTDMWLSALRENIAQWYSNMKADGEPGAGWRPPKEQWLSMLQAVLYEHQVDTFQEWLAELPEWDGTARVKDLLYHAGAPEGDPLAEWASRYVMTTVLDRTFEPGAHAHVMLIVLGPQGCGKSAVFAGLFPEDKRHEWFGDALELDESNQKKAESLFGKVIVEADEMKGRKAADIEKLKSFITRRDDGQYRRPWGRAPEQQLRRCAIVATTNDDRCVPRDPSGGVRRFCVVEAEERRAKSLTWEYVKEAVLAQCEQFWAEALVIRDGGYDRHPTPEIDELIEKAAVEHVAVNQIVADKYDDLRGKTNIVGRDGVEITTTGFEGLTMAEIMLLAGIDKDYLSQDIATLLKLDKYESKRPTVDGKKRTVWSKQ